MQAELAEIDRIRQEYVRRRTAVPADYYGWRRPVNQFRLFQVYRACIGALHREGMFPLDGRSVVDVGCGDGSWLLEFVQWGADPSRLSGLDLDEERVAKARRALPSAGIRLGDGQRMPFETESADVVTQFTVFTSILSPAVKRGVASEMLRILKPDGVILWYDFRIHNRRNPNLKPIRAAEVRSLFPGCRVTFKPVTLAPPIARAVLPLSWTLALMLESLPFLRTHYLAVISKREQTHGE